MDFVRKHLTVQRFGAIGLGLALPQFSGSLYQRVFNMMGNPGRRVSEWISTPSGTYVTAVLGTAGLLYIANRVNLISTEAAVLAAGVSTTMVVLAYLAKTVGGRVGALLPDAFNPVTGAELAGYSGYVDGGYLGYANSYGYLGTEHEEEEYDASAAGQMYGIGQPTNVNVF